MSSNTTDVGGITPGQLKQYIERIERLEEEKTGIAQDIKEVYAEAKGNGFDTNVMRQVIKIRKMDKDQREEQEELIDLYLHALGEASKSLHMANQAANSLDEQDEAA